MAPRSFRNLSWCALALAGSLSVGAVFATRTAAQSADGSSAKASSSQDQSQPEAVAPPKGAEGKTPDGSVRLRIRVTSPKGSPVSNASVYVRYYKDGGLVHKDQLQEMDFKTNQDGSVKVPPIPQGKIQIQVIAQGWHTFGEWYDIEKDEQEVSVQLEEPPHWY
jgi:hypothetical protein